MAHPKETRDKLRRLYISGNQPLETAAAISGVAVQTARRWRDAAQAAGDDWDKLRAAHTLAGGGIEELGRAMLAGFLRQYGSTMEILDTADDIPAAERVKLLAGLADAYNKTVSANARILPETSKLATALELVEFLLAFVQEKHPKHLAAFVEVMEPFGVEVEKRFG